MLGGLLLLGASHCGAADEEPVGSVGQKRGGGGAGTGTGLGRRSQAAKPVAVARRPATLLSASDLTADRVAAFRQTRATSRKLSEPEHAEHTPFGVRLVGPAQSFIAWANGYSETSTHADAPLGAGPYYRSPEAHEVAVRSYFALAGIPAEQVGRASVTVAVDMTGPMDRSADTRVAQGVTTVIHRTIDGVEVPDSFAWARLNAQDVVVAERVWWPDLPGQIRLQIAEFKAALGASFRSALPPSLATKDGEVCVHHSLPIGHRWYAMVTWDTLDKTTTRHFDVHGREVTLKSWDEDAGDARP
ncbi:MAG: hypothetical protein KC657_26320 [Myxococcales bacterium]|nr:hypothetical protein [Myxococcales bacterium]